jgi:hypothetical protein
MKTQLAGIADEVFEQERTETLLNEKAMVPIIERDDYVEGKGILVYYLHVPYPRKGVFNPQVLFALNQVKKIIIEFFRLLAKPTPTRMCISFNVVFDKVFRGKGRFNMKAHLMCPTAFNFGNFVHMVLVDLGVPNDTAREFAFNVAQILQFDDAYRYRFQDITTELNVELFKKNPRKELWRLYGILHARSVDAVAWEKVIFIMKPMSLLLYLPKLKRSFIKNVHFLKSCERDIDDWYWVCLREDNYNYGGLPLLERIQQFKERPEFVEVMS